MVKLITSMFVHKLLVSLFLLKINKSLIAPKLLATIRLQNSIVSKGANATYIALIAKKLVAQRVNDYRPISLTTNIYKILTKVLVDHLQQVLPMTQATGNPLLFLVDKSLTRS